MNYLISPYRLAAAAVKDAQFALGGLLRRLDDLEFPEANGLVRPWIERLEELRSVLREKADVDEGRDDKA